MGIAHQLVSILQGFRMHSTAKGPRATGSMTTLDPEVLAT
jgi:hypothetical protein